MKFSTTVLLAVFVGFTTALPTAEVEVVDEPLNLYEGVCHYTILYNY